MTVLSETRQSAHLMGFRFLSLKKPILPDFTILQHDDMIYDAHESVEEWLINYKLTQKTPRRYLPKV